MIMKKGKHAKKSSIPFFTMTVLLISISVFSTGIIIGCQYYQKEQETIAHLVTHKNNLNLTANEKKLTENIDQLLKKMIISAQFM